MNQLQQHSIHDQSLSMPKIIHFLQNLQTIHLINSSDNERLNNELTLLKITNSQLLDKYHSLQQLHTTIQEDFKTLSNILNQAHLFMSEKPTSTTQLAPIFEIDQNGQINVIEAKL